jgi:hypothetical protein
VSDYIADFNSAFEFDVALSLAIAARDCNALANALEEGGGGARSVDRGFLLTVAANRKGPTEIVRISSTGRAKAALKSIDHAAFLQAGLPPQVRKALIADLRNGSVQIRSRKNRGVGAGRPRKTICPDAAAGADIYAIALSLARKAHPDLTAFFGDGDWAADHWLSEAVELWIERQRNGKPIRDASEIDTWDRKSRRALSAYDNLPSRFAKMAN